VVISAKQKIFRSFWVTCKDRNDRKTSAPLYVSIGRAVNNSEAHLLTALADFYRIWTVTYVKWAMASGAAPSGVRVSAVATLFF
jgi:hypothetical protein